MKYCRRYLTLVLMVCTISCAENGAAPTLNIETTEQPKHKYFSLKDACIETSGVWSDKLFSCKCPLGKVLFEDGCTSLQFSAGMKACLNDLESLNESSGKKIDDCLSNIYQDVFVSVDDKTLSIDKKIRLIKSLSMDPAFLIKGWTFPKYSKKTKLLLSLSKLSKESFKEMYYLDLMKESHSQSVENITSILTPGFDFATFRSPRALEEWTVKCGARLRLLFGKTSAAYCGELFAGIRAIFGPAHENPSLFTPQSKSIQSGEGCLPDCKQLTFLSNPVLKTQAISKIRFREYFPIARNITLQTLDGELTAYLNPTGQLQGIVAVKTGIQENDNSLIERRLIALDENFNELESTHSSSGDNTAYARAIEKHEQHDARVHLFPYENPVYDQHGPINILLIDTGISLFNPFFLGRLAPLNRPIHFMDIAAELNETLLVKENMPHGTQMASIILKNLPDAKLSSFPFWIDPASSSEQWIDVIQTSQARIVNLSVDLAEMIFDCDGFFEKIFLAFPDVLFVVAAGNTGSLNPDTCPAKLGANSRFANVLTVAGTSSGARLHPQSSYGLGVAKIAAPFETYCVHNDSKKIQRCSGTSVSAAIVSNLAARMMIRNPHLSAKNVASAFQSSCVKQDLPMACSGAIDL